MSDTITLPRLTVAALTAAASAWFGAVVERPEANGSPRLLELGAAIRTANAVLEDREYTCSDGTDAPIVR